MEIIKMKCRTEKKLHLKPKIKKLQKDILQLTFLLSVVWLRVFFKPTRPCSTQNVVATQNLR